MQHQHLRKNNPAFERVTKKGYLFAATERLYTQPFFEQKQFFKLVAHKLFEHINTQAQKILKKSRLLIPHIMSGGGVQWGFKSNRQIHVGEELLVLLLNGRSPCWLIQRHATFSH